MPRYLISFNEGAMTFPLEDLPAVGEAAHAVLRAAKAAGAWVTGGGLLDAADTVVVHPDGTVTEGPAAGVKDFLGGFAIVDVATREEALAWAAKWAVACRCDQDVRQLMADPEV